MDAERKGECQGIIERCAVTGCPKFGLLGRPGRDGRRRVRGCGDPAARGKRNRAKGDGKARRARKMLGLAGVNSRHEEHWGGSLRIEVKAGAQVGPIATRFRDAEAQSAASKAFGDNRPFAMVAMPDGEGDGIVLMRLSQFSQIMEVLKGTS